MPDPHLANVLAALALAVDGNVQQAVDAASGLQGAGTTALIALDEFAGGESVTRLAEVVGLTHSGAVRLVASLEERGLVRRRQGADARKVLVETTPAGRRTARAARDARAGVLAAALRDLSTEDQHQLAGLLDRVTATLVADRIADRLDGPVTGAAGAWWCRQCDLAACGRPAGSCPSANAAAAALARGGTTP
jgi:DNA-binding MarR family transcriptional regulator